MSLPYENNDGANKGLAIYIAVLAVLLAINTVGGGNASKTVLMGSIQAADTYAFYQAKNMRQTSFKLAADTLELKLAEPNLPEEARKAIQEKANNYRAIVTRYESDPESGEGKKELLQKAKTIEATRDHAMNQDSYFDYSGGLLQIAIVLASASLILGSSMLLWSSVGLGALGTLMMANAFWLFFKIPFIV